MTSAIVPLSAFPDSKKHYEILDGLRGVAAVLVVIFHLLEAHSTSNMDQLMNHGYMAVDFFYVLSGFVVGYAYDDRWDTRMGIKEFFRRRLIRLHPMIVMGMIVGAICFYFQSCGLWPGISQVPIGKMLLVMVIGFTLLPVPLSMDIRGWHEMHPLNGPGWSLFYEYIANIFYALFVRKFSNTALAVLVFLSGVALLHLAVTSSNGDIIGGWSVELSQVRIGFTRLMYPFFAGLLLSRLVKPTKVKHAFWLCSLMIIILLSVPRLGGTTHLWINGLYIAVSIIFFFPLIVYLGASGELKGKYVSRISRFLGDISYPIYITHYPLVYIYTAWVTDGKLPLSSTFPVALLVLFGSVALAWLCLKFYDQPVRKFLAKRFLVKKPAPVVLEAA